MAGKRGYKTRGIALAVALAMLAELLPLAALNAWAEEEWILHIQEKGATGDEVQSAWVVRATDEVWSDDDECDGWYVVVGTLVDTNRIVVDGDVTLYLTTSSSLTVTQGIQVSEGSSLTVRSENNGDSGKLIAGQMQGEACCESMSEYCTAVAACYPKGQACNDQCKNNCCPATEEEQEKMRLYKAGIEDGRAGIGGDASAPNAGTITINSGTVIAIGGTEAAGIGGGPGGSGGTITINGGIVNASSGEPNSDGYAGAGIGGGNGGTAGTITINGGQVTATGIQNDAGIGSGSNAGGGNIVILPGETTYYEDGSSSSTVYVDDTAADKGNVVYCDNGSMYSTDSADGAGSSGSITINGGTVNAKGGSGGAGIGGGTNSAVQTIEINGGTVTATSRSIAAGIGGGFCAPGGNITINGGIVNASGQGSGTGIGGGLFAASGSITITGGEVTASGGSGGAGIGNGVGCFAIWENDRVLITGGTVTATGGTGSDAVYVGAGIGGGRGAMGTAVYITGGEVTATGGANRYGEAVGAGIGGGVSGRGNGTFATSYEDTEGSATITANSITADTDQSQWSGTINGVLYSKELGGSVANVAETGEEEPEDVPPQPETASQEETIAQAGSVALAQVQTADDASGGGETVLVLAAGAAGAACVAGVLWRLYRTGESGLATLGNAGSTALQAARSRVAARIAQISEIAQSLQNSQTGSPADAADAA
jgi:hypothetical protein